MATMHIHVAPAGHCWQCCGSGSVAKGYAECGVCHGTKLVVPNVCFQVGRPVTDQYTLIEPLRDKVFEEWALRMLIRPLRYEVDWPPSHSTVVGWMP